MHKTQIRSLGLGDPLEKEMATHSGIVGGEMPRAVERGGLCCPWRRKESDMT